MSLRSIGAIIEEKLNPSQNPTYYIVITSRPPEGQKKIRNIYWDKDTEEVVVQVED